MLKSHLAHSSSLQIPVQQAEGGILNNVNKIKLLKCVILAPAAPAKPEKTHHPSSNTLSNI